MNNNNNSPLFSPNTSFSPGETTKVDAESPGPPSLSLNNYSPISKPSINFSFDSPISNNNLSRQLFPTTPKTPQRSASPSTSPLLSPFHPRSPLPYGQTTPNSTTPQRSPGLVAGSSTSPPVKFEFKKPLPTINRGTPRKIIKNITQNEYEGSPRKMIHSLTTITPSTTPSRTTMPQSNIHTLSSLPTSYPSPSTLTVTETLPTSILSDEISQRILEEIRTMKEKLGQSDDEKSQWESRLQFLVDEILKQCEYREDVLKSLQKLLEQTTQEKVKIDNVETILRHTEQQTMIEDNELLKNQTDLHVYKMKLQERKKQDQTRSLTEHIMEFIGGILFMVVLLFFLFTIYFGSTDISRGKQFFIKPT